MILGSPWLIKITSDGDYWCFSPMVRSLWSPSRFSQETCYVTLLKLLKNIVEHPAEGDGMMIWDDD